MRLEANQRIGFLKTTAIGGIVFLLPLVVVGALLAQAGQLVWSLVQAVQGNDHAQALLPDTAIGYAVATAVGLAAVIALCFLCGLLARRSLGRWFSDRAERYLLMLFPRYAVFKEQLTGNLGGVKAGGVLKPIRIDLGPYSQLGMEVERTAAGEVIVYLPGAPDPWSGRVAIVSAAQVEPLDADPGEFMATFEKLGRGTQAYTA
ncbi:hypothetical protein [Botrimarina hoheduenensis]|uniref:DUF502 domain-containing protein n=1 Tax=Botrimarina hoheduenensis TaxID=2528000 RepID=A0A5C5W9I1_9BACT|nr:hypothetical protein [Botrimarina hoheduenensis]TWT46943.1 hypothetical protein Pla111_20450 [Botrimarina hoheduenensis]